MKKSSLALIGLATTAALMLMLLVTAIVSARPVPVATPEGDAIDRRTSRTMHASTSSHALQATYAYTSSPGSVIPDTACVTDTITVTVPAALLVADVNVGLNVDIFLFRGVLTTTLYDSTGVAVQLLGQNYMGYHANYDLMLDDESSGPMDDGNDDDTAPPYYDRDAAPYRRLSGFDGKSAQGQWTLEICGNGALADGILNTWSLWLTVRDPGPLYAVPYSYKSVPYKLQEGDSGLYVVVVTNTGELAGAATYVQDVLPPGATQSAPATYAALGSGVAVTGFHATTPITWLGSIPAGAGLVITIPATVSASAGTQITNTATITAPSAPAATAAASAEVYPAGTLHTYEGFDVDDGGFAVMDGEWRWGPPATGPLTCHSQPGCWGTSGESTLNALTGTLDLPSILPTQTLWLQWWEWLDVAEDFSIASVFLASSSNPTPTVIYGSQAPTAGLTPDQRAHEGAWREVLYDATLHASEHITLYFYYASMLPTAGPGWYIDDLGVHTQAAPDFAGSHKTASTSKVTPGGALTYTVYITNSGRVTSTAGRMFDQLPGGLAVSTVTKAGGGNLTMGTDWVEWTTTPGAPLAPHEDVSITIVAAVAPGVECGLPLVNTARITDSQAWDDTVITADPVFAYPGIHHTWDFELDTGGFLSNTTGTWEWGPPDATYPSGPPSAHGGRNVWGTDLDDPFDGDTSVLTKTVDLTGIAPATGLSLQWWEWLGADDEWHQAVVEISSATDPEPAVIHGRRTDGLTDGQRAHKRAWSHVTADITPWAGDLVTVTFSLFVSGLTNPPYYPGWYLDDVGIYTDCPHISVSPNQGGRACPGSTATYTVTVFNATESADTVNVSLDGHAWPSSADPTSLSLGPGGTGVVTVGVRVSLSAVQATADAVSVVAAGQGSGLSGAAVLETTSGANWVQASPVPADVMYHALVEYENESYLLGGPITPSRKYSPTTGIWYDLAPEPEPPVGLVTGACLGTTGGGDPVVVLFPGSSGATALHVYDVQGDSWYTAPYTSPLPSAPAIVSDRENNVCYISGGQDGSGITNTLYAYDVASNTATGLPPMATPRYFHAAWLYDGMVCVGGGSDVGGPGAGLKSTQCYSIAGGAWLPENATLGPLPYPAWAMDDAERQVGGVKQLWIMGGIKRFDIPLSIIEPESRTAHWDSDTQGWTVDAPLPYPVLLSAGDVQMDDVYVVGGASGGTAGMASTAYNQRLAPCPVPKRIYLPVVSSQ
jgi:uncharacterized repeat protein (TIGR01451 family)